MGVTMCMYVYTRVQMDVVDVPAAIDFVSLCLYHTGITCDTVRRRRYLCYYFAITRAVYMPRTQHIACEER